MPISFLLLYHPSSTPSQEGRKSQCLGIAISLTGNQLFPLLEGIPFGFWSTSRPLEELMSSLFPSLTSPVSRKVDPLDSSVCTLLSLTPPQVTPFLKGSDQCWALSLAWSRRRDSSLHPRTVQLIAGFAAKGTLQMLNTAVWFYHTEAALSQKHLSDGNTKASLQ